MIGGERDRSSTSMPCGFRSRATPPSRRHSGFSVVAPAEFLPDAKWPRRDGQPGPGPRPGAGAAYDGGRQALVLFGGAAGDNSPWELSGGRWNRIRTQIAREPRRGHGMVYDGVRG